MEFDLGLGLDLGLVKIKNKKVKLMHALRVTSEAGNTATQTSDHADHSNNGDFYQKQYTSKIIIFVLISKATVCKSFQNILVEISSIIGLVHA